MGLFEYPGTRHVRTLRPRKFKKYSTYKKYLQNEFSRLCVYCRQADSSVPSLIFSVDHYRPKGLPQFAHLLCEYSNLYYCCANCNSRKSNDWPATATSKRVVNPCDDVMSEHLRFNSKNGMMHPHSEHGEHMEELLQLNDPDRVEFRRTLMSVVNRVQLDVLELNNQEAKLLKKFSNSQISKTDFDDALSEIVEDREHLRLFIARSVGTKPLPPLPKSRMGIQLHT
ncbi:hypothetical protein [Pseudoxanthomonas indica]|uniref:TIGR02646 family protein n=1 Tax=Pseudoxanthomonas indica TaxID=428993 RepID=A0A1T5JZI9_9GAMM|nr:hypothetical protein [Pseudoxanthomonas indica]GGD45593.1 hypothetical protein GCM10007235_16890 [Pseudoxanthomonas indica]SKC56907.1 TIGR02646 family protein [Pseudoxanthomonas indica]